MEKEDYPFYDPKSITVTIELNAEDVDNIYYVLNFLGRQSIMYDVAKKLKEAL
jgi:hypothetical protein